MNCSGASDHIPVPSLKNPQPISAPREDSPETCPSRQGGLETTSTSGSPARPSSRRPKVNLAPWPMPPRSVTAWSTRNSCQHLRLLAPPGLTRIYCEYSNGISCLCSRICPLLRGRTQNPRRETGRLGGGDDGDKPDIRIRLRLRSSPGSNEEALEDSVEISFDHIRTWGHISSLDLAVFRGSLRSSPFRDPGDPLRQYIPVHVSRRRAHGIGNRSSCFPPCSRFWKSP